MRPRPVPSHPSPQSLKYIRESGPKSTSVACALPTNCAGEFCVAKPAPEGFTVHHEIAERAVEPLKPHTKNASSYSEGRPVPGLWTTPLGPSGMFRIGERM